MKKKGLTLRIILYLGALSLLGIIVTQLFWMRNALWLQEKQCDHRVMLALKSVSACMAMQQEGVYYVAEAFRADPADSTDLSRIDPILLDSVIMEHFCEMNIVRDYYYAYLNRSDSSFLFGNFQGHEEVLVSSGLYVSVGPSTAESWYVLSVYFPKTGKTIMSQMILWLVMSGLFTIILILSFGFTVFSFFRQKKLSEMKTDFVNNMTHEFKTPISTISVASEMLMREDVANDRPRAASYTDIIFKENARLKGLVERVLQIASLDREEYRVDLEDVDMHELVNVRADSFRPAISELAGTLVLALDATEHDLQVDRLHFSNVIANLIDNAIKYSGDKPDITVSTLNRQHQFVLSVKDKGIGIGPESQRNIFKKFFRVPTGNVHDVKGFGLGLYYVKSIVEAHGGEVTVHSERGKGSHFEVILPLNRALNNMSKGREPKK